MKTALFLILMPTLTWGKSLILVSYFDPFGGARINNSEKISEELNKFFQTNPEVDLRPCRLSTVFDKSMMQLEACYKNLGAEPKLILALGESDCRLKAEILGRNRDHTYYPDNEGNERKNALILPDGPEEIGLKYPLKEMYCALEKWQRRGVKISNDAGSFVCNNIAYRFSLKYPETFFGLIHVPRNNCRGIERLNSTVITTLGAMIKTAAANEFNILRFPTTKEEFDLLRSDKRNSRCETEFYLKTKGVDE
jgi:pyrrolidone-carboxylate peptidase